MSTRVVEASGAQVLPPVGDARVTVSAWFAVCCVDADLRVKSEAYRELAGRLFIEAVPE